MDNLNEQREELSSVESIFNVYENNFTFDDATPPCGHFKANVWLLNPFCVSYQIQNRDNVASEAVDIETSNTETFEVEHLPPINLFFELPETYPSDTCPAFFLSCNWLTLQQLSSLCRHLESMWDKDTQVLYLWCQFLESEVSEFLGLQQCLDITELLKYKVSNNLLSHSQVSVTSQKEKSPEVEEEISYSKNNKMQEYAHSKELIPIIKPSITGGCGLLDCRAFNDLTDGRSLIQLIKNYNDFKTKEVFNRTYHECDVCVTSKLGAEFVIFKACNHAFCKHCLKDFFEIHIREGNVNLLLCPTPKCNSQADGSMVKQIVNKDLFERYDEILLSRTLETMADIAYCPRKWCQCAVLIDPGDRMGSCPSCLFVFCPYCKMAYHGVAPCIFKSEEKQAIYEQYCEGDDDVKAMLEKRHGKRAMKALVEDSLSESWINTNSKYCPNCKSSIEKTDGCNKMTCFKCGAFFCWLCMKVLESSNPYSHFSGNNYTCILFPEDQLDNLFEFGPGEFLHYL